MRDVQVYENYALFYNLDFKVLVKQGTQRPHVTYQDHMLIFDDPIGFIRHGSKGLCLCLGVVGHCNRSFIPNVQL